MIELETQRAVARIAVLAAPLLLFKPVWISWLCSCVFC